MVSFLARKKPTLSEPFEITHCELPDSMVAHIGAIIRAFAEIENLINLRASRLLGLEFSDTIVALGRAALRAKVEVIRTLAQKHSAFESELHDQIFAAEWRYLVGARNALAHGVLLGKCESGLFHFLTSNSHVHDIGSVDLECISLAEDQVANMPAALYILTETMKKGFRLQPLLDEQREGRLRARESRQNQHGGRAKP